MSLYARSDLCSTNIPASSGGCGQTHSRPVTNGIPAKIWRLDCSPCESYLRGDRKPKIIKVIPGDKDQGIPSRMEHVADADPHWSSTPEGIPTTPDEQHVNKIRAEKGAQELQMLQALIAAKNSGINIPDNAMWLLNQTFDPRIIRGQVICANGHENTSGAKFCAECGMDMATRGMVVGEDARKSPEYALGGAVASADEIREKLDLPPWAITEPSVPVVMTTQGPVPFTSEPQQVDLSLLHVATLKKMCREKGLPDKGTKAQLIERLS